MSAGAQSSGWGPQATGGGGGGGEATSLASTVTVPALGSSLDGGPVDVPGGVTYNGYDAIIPDAASWYVDDDGISSSGMQSNVSGAGAAVSLEVDDDRAPQSNKLYAGTTAAGRAMRGYRGNQLNQFVGGGGQAPVLEWRGAYLSQDAAPTAAENWFAYAGFIDSITADSADGAYFEIVPAFGGTVISCKTANNSVRTTTATAVTLPLTSAGKYDLRVRMEAATVTFYYRASNSADGAWVLLATHTTNLPSGTARRFGAGIAVIGSATAGGTTRSLRYAIQACFAMGAV